MERKKEIEVEEKENLRKAKELMATTRLPAEAEVFRIKMIAEGMKKKALAEAEGEANTIKLIGKAEATIDEAIGNAEAEGMRVKADAYKQYGEAALVAMVLENLPNIAYEVARPLAKTKDIVLIGSGGNTGHLSSLVAGLPRSMTALAGSVLNKENNIAENIKGPDISKELSNMEMFFRRRSDKIPPVDVPELKADENENFSSLIFNGSSSLNSSTRSRGRSKCHHSDHQT